MIVNYSYFLNNSLITMILPFIKDYMGSQCCVSSSAVHRLSVSGTAVGGLCFLWVNRRF